jgi:hypothetical protein
METASSSETPALNYPKARPHFEKDLLKLTDYYMGNKEDRQCTFNVFQRRDAFA